MHIEFLVEEASAEAALNGLLPKIVGDRATWLIHPHQGKPDLLRQLPYRLRGYSRWLPEDYHIIVLVDRDRDDCRDLKNELDDAALSAALGLRGRTRGGRRDKVSTRIAIEELEAWFFGDVEALVTAYPRVPRTLDKRAGYRDPDSIAGGTWEALERVLQRAGYFPAGLPKIEVARRVAAQMEPSRNRSGSFQCFRDMLLDLVGRGE